MKNIINSPIKGIDESLIDSLFPFENRTVWIWHVSKKKTGYGHWRLVIDMDIDEKKIVLSAVTTNSRMIDYWDGIDESDTQEFYPADYVGRINAITAVLESNEETLLEFIANQETSEQEQLNNDHLNN